MISNYKNYINKNNQRTYVLIFFLIMSLVFLGLMVNFSFIKIYKGIPSMYNLFERMMSPNLAYGQEVFSKLLETIEIAVTSTIMGVLLAIPFALLTARNITPNKYISIGLNTLFSFLRTIPNLIWAALLVSIFSIGQLPGMMALTITAFLISLKLFKENIETISENLINSTKSVGATRLQILRHCVLPTMLELTVSVFFMVFETNIRSATVLGLVGAGGIGQIMWRDLNHLRYDNLATLILMLFITILTIDGLSLLVRNQIKKTYIPCKSIESHRRFIIFRGMTILVIFLIIILGVFNSIDINMLRFKLGLEQAQSMILRMFYIDLTYLSRLLEGIKESFFIAIFSTLTGAIGALFLSFFAAYNTSPSKAMVLISKGITNILRTFPPIVTAIIFFRGVGPGPLAGSMALSIYTTGVLTKLYSEVIEHSHENTKNSILSTGCSNLISFRHGILPQTLPTFISLVLYRLESNIRTSTILGIIGAGGIGTILSMNITWRNWERVGLLILGIAVMVMIIDSLSYYLRKRMS